MKKVVLVLILLLGFNLVSAYSFHSASEIYLEIDGNDMNLQQAYTNGLLIGGHTYSVPTKIVFGHPIDKVIISTYSGEMNLLDALNGNVKLIGESRAYSTVDGTDEHYATEINFSDGSTLQEVINSGDLAWCSPSTCVELGYNCGIHNDGCGANINCGTGSTVSCSSSYCRVADSDFLYQACNNGILGSVPSCTYTPRNIGKTCTYIGYEGNYLNYYPVSTDGTCTSYGICAGDLPRTPPRNPYHHHLSR